MRRPIHHDAHITRAAYAKGRLRFQQRGWPPRFRCSAAATIPVVGARPQPRGQLLTDRKGGAGSPSCSRTFGNSSTASDFSFTVFSQPIPSATPDPPESTPSRSEATWPPCGPPVPTGGRLVRCSAMAGGRPYPLPRRDGGGLGWGPDARHRQMAAAAQVVSGTATKMPRLPTSERTISTAMSSRFQTSPISP